MAKKVQVEETKEQKFINKVSTFLVNNRVGVLCTCLAVILVIVLIVVISSVSSSKKEKAMERLDALNARYASYSIMDKNEADFASTGDALLADLEKEVKGDSYTSVKASYLIGLTYFEQEKFSEASDAFMKAYELNKDIYLAPLSLINAAVCKESLKDTNGAFELYKKASEYPEFASKALFNIARIYLAQGDKALAKATLQQLTDLNISSEYKAIAEDLLTTM